MPNPSDFIDRPGLPGPFGALMDEYARAATDFCRVVEQVPEDLFNAERESDDPDTRSIRAVCEHALRAARGYSIYILRARGRDTREIYDWSEIRDPKLVRAELGRALRYAEEAVEGLNDCTFEEIMDLRFQVRWGPTYDPDSMLEHAICHLLRHRRQIERW